MNKPQFLEYCLNTYGTSPDYPFDEDFETAVLRHWDNRKWYAIVMGVSRRKFGFDSDEVIDAVNLKLPVEMFGSFSATEGIYLAYHTWACSIGSLRFFPCADDIVQFLVNVSFEATKDKRKRQQNSSTGYFSRDILFLFLHSLIFLTVCNIIITRKRFLVNCSHL